MAIDDILSRAVCGERITDAEALELLGSSDLTLLGMAAHEARLRRHPDGVVTYIIERNVNYSNICAADCDFCGFHAKPWDKQKAYVLTSEELDIKIEEMVRLGGRQVLLQGGLHPNLKLECVEIGRAHV